MRKLILMIAIVTSSVSNYAQEHNHEQIDGYVKTLNKKGELVPISFANVIWEGTTKGTQTNIDGYYKLEKLDSNSSLVFSYVGFIKDTFDVAGKDHFDVELISVTTDVVRIKKRKKSSVISDIDPLKVERIGEKELHKGACCNLSESFETTPSVDVSFTDAITGTRQIQMLGLAGQYTQILRENIPSIKGLSTTYGLGFVPGSWVKGIQLNKGPGSVVNGYESISGQINLELKKPSCEEKLFVNAFANAGGRIELNLTSSKQITEKLSTAVLLHGKQNKTKFDRNKDGFLDMPLSENLIGMSRWMYVGNNGWRGQFGVKGTYISTQGGQMNYKPIEDVGTTNAWGLKLDLSRYEGFAKMGKVYEDIPWKSMGFQFAASTHEQNSYYGLKKYDAKENSFYANYIYQSIISNTFHIIKTGASFKYDNTNEGLDLLSFNREEIVPGVFGEYTYSGKKKFKMVAGLRADYHNLFGAFVTPRLQLKYDFSKKSIMRASAGRGLRTANIISENSGLLASNRAFEIQGDGSNKPYGLDAEIAWNFGLNYTKKFTVNKKDGSISFDLYRTNFENQIVVDLDESAQKAVFYNLQGKSYSNSFQGQFDYELFPRFDVRLAYRWFDVKTSYGDDLLKKPLVSSHRAFANIAYETNNKWSFDYTVSWQGQKRIPNTDGNPMEFQLEKSSPSFFLMNAQITKKWKKKFHAYAGVENIHNFVQENPILGNEQPFGNYFDASQIWGPIFGRMTYVGLRYYVY